MPETGLTDDSASTGGSLQVVGQAIAAVVAVLGATGYIIALGAVVLWVRLGEAGFPREVPLSTASKQELLVQGAEALAVWIALAMVLLMLAARLLTTPGMRTEDIVASLVWGLLVSIGVLAAIDTNSAVVRILIGLALAAGVVRICLNALWLRPPIAAWAMALMSVAIGALLPFLVRWLGGAQSPAVTVLSAWAAFILVLVLLRRLTVTRTALLTTNLVAGQLQRTLEPNRPTRPIDPSTSILQARSTDERLLQALRARARVLRTSLWLRSVGVGLIALLLLGGVAVASQFDRESLFRSALVSLNTGRCVRGTYLAHGNDRVVLGDQELFITGSKGLPRIFRHDHFKKKRRHGRLGAPQNKVVVIPDNEILELQVLNPTAVGVPLETIGCKAGHAVVAPDGSQAELFRGPAGPKGSTGATGPRGPKGASGATGTAGPKGTRGAPGQNGSSGLRGPRGERGPTGGSGKPGPPGPRGPPGPVAATRS